MTFTCEVYIRPRADILDPQGDAVLTALQHLGFESASQVRIGKYVVLTLEAENRPGAEALARQMCEKLLANPITEDFELTVSGG
jgi:phosphoribosylformylglycinamidine synthase